jgi:hypothetical protein
MGRFLASLLIASNASAAAAGLGIVVLAALASVPTGLLNIFCAISFSLRLAFCDGRTDDGQTDGRTDTIHILSQRQQRSTNGYWPPDKQGR